jgi:hypothetical protein
MRLQVPAYNRFYQAAACAARRAKQSCEQPLVLGLACVQAQLLLAMQASH